MRDQNYNLGFVKVFLLGLCNLNVYEKTSRRDLDILLVWANAAFSSSARLYKNLRLCNHRYNFIQSNLIFYESI
jgi:hypothetical protein